MDSDGILGRKQSSKSSNPRKKWLKTREMWLVVIGVILHAFYMLSIFDIYFKTPIVHGIDSVTPRFKAPTKRLVFLVGTFSKLLYTRCLLVCFCRWGVSHAGPPTESRPGHVALIAGFYEDPSAVTKGWKANPVEFDSVFNQSRHTISYGSPDIVPIFCGALPHSTWNTYPHDYEDFATDASFLDEWSFDQFQSLLNRSNEDPKLKELLLQDNLVIFLHLLGCDSNGQAHRPFLSIYLNNVKVVDHSAERMYSLLEGYFKDNRTSYVFTADHGMRDKGSHGDGHPTNTDTPLVVWEAGVNYPKPLSGTNHSDCGFRFVDEHAHDTPTPKEWGLDGIERVDVNQADIAPLMLGLGNLPLEYINMNEAEKVEAVLANTKQILSQFLQKSRILFLYHLLYSNLDYYEAAMKLSENLRSSALQGLHYFQTYDWLMLMSVINSWLGAGTSSTTTGEAGQEAKTTPTPLSPPKSTPPPPVSPPKSTPPPPVSPPKSTPPPPVSPPKTTPPPPVSPPKTSSPTVSPPKSTPPLPVSPPKFTPPPPVSPPKATPPSLVSPPKTTPPPPVSPPKTTPPPPVSPTKTTPPMIASHYVERGANYITGRICVLELVLHAVTGANLFHQELMGTESFVAGATLI
ncbi:hypothetical protein Patl1_21946 [Pistacia atlantica]|uniref:Uncharacterized protein n=1 Tax=Pistacia atlantica TaxID=434234 RepID=A0ACC1BNR2_9ROSI|nr:hypothetical protein Patl1_21946 [Pistacia atlantica]